MVLDHITTMHRPKAKLDFDTMMKLADRDHCHLMAYVVDIQDDLDDYVHEVRHEVKQMIKEIFRKHR